MTDTQAQSQDTLQPNPYRGYKRFVNPLFAMILLFGLPYAISWYFMYSGDPVAFEKPNNHGTLVSPVIPLGQFSLTLHDDSTFTQDDIKGKWSLITISSSCDKTCEETLFSLRQTRKAMGVSRKVIKPIILLPGNDALAPVSVDLSKEFPQLAVVTQQNDDTRRLLETFESVFTPIENSIFMVDPSGNLMMVYPAKSEPKGMLKDLQRLLKVYKPDL